MRSFGVILMKKRFNMKISKSELRKIIKEEVNLVFENKILLKKLAKLITKTIENGNTK